MWGTITVLSLLAGLGFIFGSSSNTSSPTLRAATSKQCIPLYCLLCRLLLLLLLHCLQ